MIGKILAYMNKNPAIKILVYIVLVGAAVLLIYNLGYATGKAFYHIFG